MRRTYVWIVQVKYPNMRWRPTVGCALDRAVARTVLRDWKLRNPNDAFRLAKYYGSTS